MGRNLSLNHRAEGGFPAGFSAVAAQQNSRGAHPFLRVMGMEVNMNGRTESVFRT